ncbi:MAG: hypothetical protein KGL78_10230 [Burkholderiales bacterium]|nr:hypothetical protein [Burkholderiales bacterium]
MSDRRLSRRTWVTTTVAAAALIGMVGLAGCASGTPRAERYVPPAMGASWSYRITSTGSFGSGSADVPMRVSQTEWQGRRLLRFENPSGATLQDDRVGVVAVLDRNGRAVMSYEPALTYRWPLEVGRSWTEELVLRVTSGSGAVQDLPMKTNWRVEAYEDVTVPAGTFKAWRVVMEDNFGFRQTTWSVPDTMGVFARRLSERGPNHPQGGAGTQLMELLSVPAVR